GPIAREEARGIWKDGFAAVREKHVVAYYEGAMLGSLSGSLETRDVPTMLTTTARAASALVDAPVVGRLRSQLYQANPATSAVLGCVTDVVKRTWTSSPRGRDAARAIAFRKMPFGEYTSIQIKLWFFEGLRPAVEGRDWSARLAAFWTTGVQHQVSLPWSLAF